MKSKWFLVLLIILLIPSCSPELDRSIGAGTDDEAVVEIQDVGEPDSDGLSESQLEMVADDVRVSITVAEDTVADSGTTIIVRNDSGRTCTFGTYYCLETEADGVWYTLPFAGWEEEEIAWDDLGYEVGPRGEQFSLAIDWEWLYGELAPGKYRIVKDMFYESDWEEKYYVCAEFIIEE